MKTATFLGLFERVRHTRRHQLRTPILICTATRDLLRTALRPVRSPAELHGFIADRAVRGQQRIRCGAGRVLPARTVRSHLSRERLPAPWELPRRRQPASETRCGDTRRCCGHLGSRHRGKRDAASEYSSSSPGQQRPSVTSLPVRHPRSDPRIRLGRFHVSPLEF